MAAAEAADEFLSTPSARRATISPRKARSVSLISIHALREEGDDAFQDVGLKFYNISIHALREEGDHWSTMT